MSRLPVNVKARINQLALMYKHISRPIVILIEGRPIVVVRSSIVFLQVGLYKWLLASLARVILEVNTDLQNGPCKTALCAQASSTPMARSSIPKRFLLFSVGGAVYRADVDTEGAMMEQ